MKKILLCGILALAAGGMAFGQWPDGFSVSSVLYTGLRADFSGGDYWEAAYPDEKDRSSFSFWHDDAGNLLRLTMRYEQENYGFAFRPQWFFNDSTAGIHYAYGWFELFNDMVKVSAGKINNYVWYTPDGEIERHYSNGLFRIEVKPIEGLNFGWALGNRDSPIPQNGNVSVNDLGGRISDVFATSSFGAKYSSDAFTFAAGLELRPEGANRRTDGDDFIASLTDGSSIADGVVIASGETSVSAYAGLQVKPMDALTIQVTLDSGSLDKADKYGFIRLYEYLEYSLGGVTPWIEAQQLFDLTETYAGKWSSPDHIANNETGLDQTPLYMEFKPGLDFDIADGLSGYVAVPVKLLDKQFEIGAMPGLVYAFGPSLEIECYYKFVLSGAGYEVYKNNDPAINNTVQVNFTWTF